MYSGCALGLVSSPQLTSCQISHFCSADSCRRWRRIGPCLVIAQPSSGQALRASQSWVESPRAPYHEHSTQTRIAVAGAPIDREGLGPHEARRAHRRILGAATILTVAGLAPAVRADAQ
jgi:hypothetical protein